MGTKHLFVGFFSWFQYYFIIPTKRAIKQDEAQSTITALFLGTPLFINLCDK
jgi:hypothetical protein